MNLSFLDDLFKGIGGGLADVDKFVDREMPFDSGWAFPAAVAGGAYFGGPAFMGALGEGGAGLGGAEGLGTLDLADILSSTGFTPAEGNSFSIFDAVPDSQYIEQDLYPQSTGTPDKPSENPLEKYIKEKAQKSALDQLGKSGSSMQQQGNQQQAEQNKMAQLQAMMRGGQPVNTTAALLSLLEERQQSKQPRISLI